MYLRDCSGFYIFLKVSPEMGHNYDSEALKKCAFWYFSFSPTLFCDALLLTCGKEYERASVALNGKHYCCGEFAGK